MSGALLQIGSAIDAVSSLFGASGAVILDDVTFAGFEVPEIIRWGGSQQVTVHKLTGGERVIDSMGRDDMPLTWSGILQGSNATARGRMLDQLRIAGEEVELTWSDFDYTVVVTLFEVDFTKPYWQPYRITCTVQQDEAQVGADAPISPLDSVLSDVGSAVGLPNLSTASITSGLATVQQAAGVLTTLTGGSPAAVALLGSVSAVTGNISLSLGVANAGLGTLSRVAQLAGAASNAGALAGLTAAAGFVGRAAKTIAAA